MAEGRCPEALYGHHGEPNTSGRCPYCGATLRSRGKGIARQHEPREDREARAERRYAVDWTGHVVVPSDQDSLEVDYDPESRYYEE